MKVPPLPYWLVALGLVAAPITVVVLVLQGQPLWCACGSLIPWSMNIWTDHNSQHVIDPYTPTHVLHGVVLYFFVWLPGLAWKKLRPSTAWSFLIVQAIETFWELLENSPIIIDRYREGTVSLDYYGDSALNSASDILACALGFWITLRLPWWGSLAFLVVTELVLLVAVRDNLTLNVIMLLYPIAAIKSWQLSGAPTP